MAVFLDTGFLLAIKNKDDKNHKAAQAWMRRFLRNEFGQIFTSYYVLNELVTLALVRLGRPDVAKNLGEFVMTSKRITLVNVSDDDFSQAWTLFCQYLDKGLSFTDCSILAQCTRFGCNFVATFDRHFEGLKGTLKAAKG